MPRIKYVGKQLHASTLTVIERANKIIAEYAAQGFVLTLRQLYYQFVARELIENTMREYKKLGGVVAEGRMAGLIDWDAIEDRTRVTHEPSTWNGPSAIIGTCADQYQRDLWADQKYRPEVWIEKDALGAICENACEPFRVPWFACRGYVSQSAMWKAGAIRLRGYYNSGQTPVVIHLGDHDPSGMDMTRDIQKRLKTFAGRRITVRRIALNSDQIAKYRPPPNPAKITDSRFDVYSAEHGTESWELDALSPAVLVKLIQATIRKFRVAKRWRCLAQLEELEKSTLRSIADNFDHVRALLGDSE